MSDQRRDILTRVADGSLTPEDAAERLRELESPESESPANATDAPAVGPIARIRVAGAFRTAKISGDSSVREAVAEGAHSALREGDTLVIGEQHAGSEESGFRFTRSDRPGVIIGMGNKPVPLHVRMNPALPLDVEIAAGTLSIKDVSSAITAEVSAGAVKIERFAGPLEINVASGAVHASGLLDTGASRIRCEAGVVKVTLDRRSSVRVTARAGLGKVKLEGMTPSAAEDRAARGWQIGGQPIEAVFGDGAATLDIETSMGVVVVAVEK